MIASSPQSQGDGPLPLDGPSIAATARLVERHNGHAPVPGPKPRVPGVEELNRDETREGGGFLGRLVGLFPRGARQKSRSERLLAMGQQVISAAAAAERASADLKEATAQERRLQDLSVASAVSPTTEGPVGDKAGLTLAGAAESRALNPALPAMPTVLVIAIEVIVILFEAAIWFMAFSTNVNWQQPDPILVLTASAIAAGLTTASLIMAHGWGAAVQRLLRHRVKGHEGVSQLVTAAGMTVLFALLIAAYVNLAIWRFSGPLTLGQRDHPPYVAMAIVVAVLPLAVAFIRAGLMSEHDKVARHDQWRATRARWQLRRAKNASTDALAHWSRVWHSLYGEVAAIHAGVVRLVDRDSWEDPDVVEQYQAVAEQIVVDGGPAAVQGLRILCIHRPPSSLDASALADHHPRRLSGHGAAQDDEDGNDQTLAPVAVDVPAIPLPRRSTEDEEGRVTAAGADLDNSGNAAGGSGPGGTGTESDPDPADVLAGAVPHRGADADTDTGGQAGTEQDQSISDAARPDGQEVAPDGNDGARDGGGRARAGIDGEVDGAPAVPPAVEGGGDRGVHDREEDDRADFDAAKLGRAEEPTPTLDVPSGSGAEPGPYADRPGAHPGGVDDHSGPHKPDATVDGAAPVAPGHVGQEGFSATDPAEGRNGAPHVNGDAPDNVRVVPGPRVGPAAGASTGAVGTFHGAGGGSVGSSGSAAGEVGGSVGAGAGRGPSERVPNAGPVVDAAAAERRDQETFGRGRVAGAAEAERRLQGRLAAADARARDEGRKEGQAAAEQAFQQQREAERELGRQNGRAEGRAEAEREYRRELEELRARTREEASNQSDELLKRIDSLIRAITDVKRIAEENI